VGYRSEELYAILCLESHRQRTTLVGENLGTVPPAVNTALSRHGIRKMYVVQYEAQPLAARPLRRVPADSVASVNTHDMPPFAAYLGGLDLQDRLALGLLTQPQLPREQRVRQRIRRALAGFFRRSGRLDSSLAPDTGFTRASLAWLAKSAAAAVIINLEDLWVETAPQNVPGTGLERPNWRRKSRYTLEELTTRPDLLETVRLVAEARKPRERRRR
jgi:4-alpha-glucanotransferase